MIQDYLQEDPSVSTIDGYVDPKMFLKDFITIGEDPLLAGGIAKPKRKLVDILVPGGQDKVWTDIPGKMYYRSNDYNLLNTFPNKENKQNLLKTLPDPRLRTYIGESEPPYFKQFGPRQYGTGSI